MKLELIGVPVSDVDRAKAFYTDSICIGIGLTKMPPGSIDVLQVVVPDAQQAHDELTARGVEVSDVDVQSWGSFVYLSDPDGNRWALQELPKRD